MEGKIGLVTDGSCDLPSELTEKIGIEVVAVHVNNEEGEPILLRDKSFYEFLRSFKKKLFTSQPSVGQFITAYEKLSKIYSSIISIHLTAARSGTFQSAMMAKETFPGVDISIIDSKSTSLGLGMLVLEAQKHINLGKKKEEIIEIINTLIPRIKTYAVLDMLDFALKGGRVDGLKLFIGSLLNLKPIIHFNNGIPMVLETLQGRKKVLDKAFNILKIDIEKSLKEWPGVRVGLAHADAHEAVKQIKEKILSINPELDIIETYAGPVLGAHAGPNAVGLFLVPSTS